MIVGGILFLALVALAVFLLWSQNNRLKVLEFELKALQRAFMAMRARIDEPDSATARGGAQAVGALERFEPAVQADPVPESAAEPAETGDGDDPDLPPDAASEPAEPSPGPGEQAQLEQQPQADPARPDIESALGGRWAVWVGGLALALGGVFLVRYSIEAGLLGPEVRLLLASLLGIAAGAGGEYLRRSGKTLPVGGVNAAYLPGILTAAGAFILFGVVFAAHGLYGFIGPTVAFSALAIISIATVGLALVHGQAFGGLGLLGSLATPALVTSEAPNAWALFGFLAIALAATAYVARIGRWWPMMSAAIIGTGLWCLAYLLFTTDISVPATVFIALVPIALLTAVWSRPSDEGRPFALDVLIPTLATAIIAALEILGLGSHAGEITDPRLLGLCAIVAALIAAAAWRPAALPLLVAAGVAVILWQIWAHFVDLNVVAFIDGVVIEGEPRPVPQLIVPVTWLIAALFLGSGIWQARERVAVAANAAAVWALFACLIPLLVFTLLWTGLGNINRDLGHALIFIALAVVLVAGAELSARIRPPETAAIGAVAIFSTGALAALVLAIHAGFGPGMTTVLCGIAIILPIAALKQRAWPFLPVLSVGMSLVVVGRIAFDPSIVGELDLGATPVFNWLLPGYGVPAIGAIIAAWWLKQLADGRMRLVQEAFAALFSLLTAAILVRHAMNGGMLSGDTVSLAEQAIYTLIAIGGGAVLVALDTRSPSPVFRIGSMIVGGLSVAFIVISHFIVLNPLATNESTGQISFFNLLLLAYLLPAAAMAGLALYARPKRPQPYVACLGLVAAALAFAYVTLSIRRLYWGEFIGAWKGLTEWETYTYSAAWLALGVVILIIGIRLRSTALRLASAGLIVIAVAKVFVFDMSQLEGALRALSFIGLGAVLIGIGIFYQRVMASPRRNGAPASDPAAGPTEPG